MKLAGGLQVLHLAVEPLGGARGRKPPRVMHARVLPAHLVRQALPAARPLDAHAVLCRRASSRKDGRGSEPARRAAVSPDGRGPIRATVGRSWVVDAAPISSHALIAAPGISHLPRGLAATRAPLSMAR